MADTPRWPGQVAFPVGTAARSSRSSCRFATRRTSWPRVWAPCCRRTIRSDRMEVFVADGMSTDGTRAIVADLASRHPQHSVRSWTIRGASSPRASTPRSLSPRATSSSGSMGTAASPGTTCRAASITSVATTSTASAGRSTRSRPTPVGRVIAAAMSSPFGVGGSTFRTVTDTTMLVDTVPFPAYTQRAIDIAGPYDEELVRNQDDEYNYRLRKLGARMLLAADVKSDYYSRTLAPLAVAAVLPVRLLQSSCHAEARAADAAPPLRSSGVRPVPVVRAAAERRERPGCSGCGCSCC